MFSYSSENFLIVRKRKFFYTPEEIFLYTWKNCIIVVGKVFYTRKKNFFDLGRFGKKALFKNVLCAFL